jgi:hypothetical protein
MSQYAADLLSLCQYLKYEVRRPLLHQTDASNLSSIVKYGLLSKAAAEAEGIAPTNAGGNGLTRHLDNKHGLWSYAFVGFTKHVVMPKHDSWPPRRTIVLHIDPGVLLISGVKIALGRANHRGTKQYKAKYAVGKMDHEVFVQVMRGTWNDCDADMRRRINQVMNYEVLVPDRVPSTYIVDAEPA